MPALFAILGLLLCLIAIRAEELPVIQDSEANSVRRQKRRGARFRRLRHDQPTRDHMYQFWTRLPQSDVRWIHFGWVNNCNRPADRHAPRDKDRDHRHNRALPRETGDRGPVDKPN
jgi:hypothetical protein